MPEEGKSAFDELFADADVISTYSDENARDDGFIVALDGPFVDGLTAGKKQVNRCSKSLWDAATRQLLNGAMTDVTYLLEVLRTVEADGKRIGPDGSTVRDMVTYEGIGLDPKLPNAPFTIWLCENEVGGLTALFPEDY